MKKIALLALSLTIFMTACPDPTANKPKAKVNEPSATKSNDTKETKTSDAKGVELDLATDATKVEFVGSKVTGKHEGGFKNVTGKINLVGDKAEDSSVTVEIDMKSTYTDSDKLTEHLLTGDFFEVGKHPKSTFTSTKIVKAEGDNSYTVTGDLTLRGEKKSITFPATIKISDDKVEVDADFAINRKDFGIVYTGKADDLIRDNVGIKFDLETNKKK